MKIPNVFFSTATFRILITIIYRVLLKRIIPNISSHPTLIFIFTILIYFILNIDMNRIGFNNGEGGVILSHLNML